MSRREQSYFDRLKKEHSKNARTVQATRVPSRLGSRGGELDKNKVDKAWSLALKSCQLPKYLERKKATVKPASKAWKTIRLFVSSTFLDFQFERDLLVKKVFPDLRTWCKERKLHLVEIDLRWGVPSGADAELAVQTCFGEIDRCYKENTFPFFLSMVSERVGWIPHEGNGVTDSIRSEFDWIDNLSITEMEHVHGAFRCQNPNALFLLRNPSFLQFIPNDVKSSFVDESLISAYKASKFRDQIEENFPDTQKVLYYAKYNGKTNESGVPMLSGFESLLVEKVLQFFKSRIELQYPSVNQEKVNKWQVLKELHEVFKDDEASMIGDLPVWNHQIDDLRAYVKIEAEKSPYMLSAVSGSGKSSCLATFLNRIHEDLPDFNIFFHFVGAVPGSVSYAQMIKRIAVFLGLDENKNVSSVVGAIKSYLSSTVVKILIVIDAYNQLDEMSLTWLPCPLQANVNVIITGREDVVEHLQKNYSRELYVNTLKKMTEDDRKHLVQTFLGKFNKTLDNEQLESLISKQSSSSFYWLSLACEELRIFGHFSLLTDKILNLPDDLVELQCLILRRLETDLENRSWLLVATLCLLFTSRTGLLEDELMEILAEPPNILPLHMRDERFPDRLALKKWKEIQRVIRPFVKYNGDTAENRLNIYHSSFKEAIKKIYFSENPSTFSWFHGKLHCYFENCVRLDRKLEEYPFHLAFCNETEKLAAFLCEPEVIANYYDPNFSKELTQLWSSVDKDFSTMAETYISLANDISEDSELHLDERIRQILILADICFQNGKFPEVLQIVEVIEPKLDLINDEDNERRMRAIVFYQKAKTIERKLFLPKKDSSETVDEIAEIEKILVSSFNLLKEDLSDNELSAACADICNRLAMLFYRKGRKHSKDNDNLYEKNLNEAVSWLDKGEEAYMRCDDFIGYANCQTSRAICERDFNKKRVSFVAAEKILGGGGLHPTYGRFCRNKGRFHKLLGENDLARKYLDNFYHNSVSLYGQKHPETLRALQLLQELTEVEEKA